MRRGPVTQLRSLAAVKRDVVLDGSYPGGKSGAGVFQRLINLIPRHRILVSAFAGHCGIVRNIKPAEHTIVIDPNPEVCQWWSDWCRRPEGRALEVHHCDSIEWMRFQFRLTKYSAAGSSADAGVVASRTGKKDPGPSFSAAGDGVFIFCDPPYVLSERSHGKIYANELCDDGHRRLLEVATQIPSATAAVMICGYKSRIYRRLNHWRSIDHRVPTRGGLQDERIWLSYPEPEFLHDTRFIGDDRRERERIRRRQANWRKQLDQMSEQERAAMLEVLNGR